MARIESPDGGGWFELKPVHVSRSRRGNGEGDAVICEVRLESYGEPVEGEFTLSAAGLTRMIERLKAFTEKRQGMLQLRTDTQELEISLAARRSHWTRKIRVTALSNMSETEPEQSETEKGNAEEELRVSFGVIFRQHGGAGGNVEHRCGMHCTFDALTTFAENLHAELAASPRRRETGRITPGQP